jgi:hypothetical protein
MADDSSIEFDMFEDMRRNLVQVLMSEGHELIAAEKIALYVVQGVRDVPKLLATLAEPVSQTPAEKLKVLKATLNNAAALEKARVLLLCLDNDNQTELH